MTENASDVDLSTLVSLCKRRGFIFQSSEIYGGLASTWDYGPLGVELKRNVKDCWWQSMVLDRDDMVGLDSSILMNSQVWEASGHVDNFVDPLVECKQCNFRFRPDQIWISQIVLPNVPEAVCFSGNSITDVNSKVSQLLKKQKLLSKGDLTDPKQITTQDFVSLISKMPCPACENIGEFTEPHMFNLMFKTFMGPVEEDASTAFLRPETAQGIFVNFNNVLTSTRRKLPFGIAQIGKAFRNEVTTGNFIFRTREFEMMEIEYFVKPDTADEIYDNWIENSLKWYLDLGVNQDRLRISPHDQAVLAHYSKATSDIEYLFPWGWGEIQGIANRTDFDLKAHSEQSGIELTYFDEESGEHIVPYVIEPSAGVDRAVLTFLVDSYSQEQVTTPGGKTENRVVLKLHPTLAPVKIAVLPLSRNEQLVPLAHKICDTLRGSKIVNGLIQYDDAQSIGRRYRRQDEIGTPLCVTVDFDSLEDDAVTIRDRDSMSQVRVPIESLTTELKSKLTS